MFSLRNLTICSALVFTAACGSDSSSNNNNNNSGGDANTLSCPNGPVTSGDIAAVYPAANPNACSGTMFATYKDAGFQAVNNSIIQLATGAGQNANIGNSFVVKLGNANDTRIKEFTTNLGTFLEYAYGNQDANYVGPSMVTAHGDLAITVAQYGAFISDVVVPALSSNGVASSDISNCFAPVVTDPTFVAQIVTCK